LYLRATVTSLLPKSTFFRDTKKAASRLAGAVVAGEKIAVFGDYNVDGRGLPNERTPEP
jgi:single-stranded-DNA-specific exonuclease